jgi:hypothetical protein
MDNILIGTLTCISYIILLSKTFGFDHMIKWQAVYDLIFTIGIPVFLAGTLGGAVIAIIAGLEFSIFVWVIRTLKRLNTNK